MNKLDDYIREADDKKLDAISYSLNINLEKLSTKK